MINKRFYVILFTGLVFTSCGKPDCDKDGIPDSQEIKEGTQLDCDKDGKPDDCTPPWDYEHWNDCNGNCKYDTEDIITGYSTDVDGNGVPDECED